MKPSQLIEVPFKGRSMGPIFKDGDELIVDCQFNRIDKIALGDIALYRINNELVAHRLILLKGKYSFKGDRSLRSETISHVLGKVIALKRDEKYFYFCDNKIFKQLVSTLSSAHLRFQKNYIIRNIFSVFIVGLNYAMFLLVKKKIFSGPETIFD